jgi:RecB family exonuclease
MKFLLYDECDNDLIKLSLLDLSYSRMDTYSQCPLKYYYKYVQKEQDTFSPAATLGNILHDVLEEYIDQPHDTTLLIDFFHVKRDGYDPNKDISPSLIEDGERMLMEFYDRTGGEPLESVIGKEQMFLFIIGKACIRGFIDRIDYDKISNTIHITDYKSGKYEITYKDVKNNLQLGIYALAASLLYPTASIYAELYYLRSGRRKGHLYTEEDLQITKNTLIDLANKIINDRSFLPTSNLNQCLRLCDFSKNDVCSVGTYRVRSKGYQY